MLESKDGCLQETFSNYINLLRFFEHHHIAQTIIINTKKIDGKMFCELNTIEQIFNKYS